MGIKRPSYQEASEYFSEKIKDIPSQVDITMDFVNDSLYKIIMNGKPRQIDLILNGKPHQIEPISKREQDKLHVSVLLGQAITNMQISKGNQKSKQYKVNNSLNSCINQILTDYEKNNINDSKEIKPQIIRSKKEFIEYKRKIQINNEINTPPKEIEILDSAIIIKWNDLLERLGNSDEKHNQNTIAQEIYGMIQDIYPSQDILLKKFREEYVIKDNKANGMLIKGGLSLQRLHTAIKDIGADIKRRSK